MLIDMLRDIEKKAEPAAAPDRGDLAHVQPSDLLSDTVGQGKAESTAISCCIATFSIMRTEE
jgi:hypothetical protein